MKRVLVIGANSYIGKKFLEYVKREKIEDIQITMASASDGSWIRTDFKGFDSVLHLSGIVHKKEKKAMEPLYYEVNYKLAVKVARKAQESNAGQFIFMSTAAVFGTVNGPIIKETPLRPDTFYGKSKLAAEKAIGKMQSEDFKVAIVRPPMVYGEGCRGNYRRLEQLSKYTFIFPAYHNKRSMVHIDTLSEYLIGIIRKEENGYFHPQDPDYADTCQIVEDLRKKMGKKTVLISGFNFIIAALIRRVGVINKMFGDFYYDNSGGSNG